MNVLSHIESERAAQIAYEVYRSASGNRASMAVWLIKHIAHPTTIAWVSELLADPNVAGWGVGLLDQLLWRERISPGDAEHLLVAAEQPSSTRPNRCASKPRSSAGTCASEPNAQGKRRVLGPGRSPARIHITL